MASSSERTTHDIREVLGSYTRTTLFCAVIGVVLWLLDLAYPLWGAVLISLCFGYAVNTASMLLQPILLRHLPVSAALTVTAVAGIVAGLLLAGLAAAGDPAFYFADSGYSTVILGLFFGVLGLLFFTTQERLKTTRAALADARAEQLNREKAHLETQLKLLQAQIEPHFLFNTLSNVIGMIRDQPEAAEKMLLNLTTLLRASLQRTRKETSSLGDELAIVEALLRINQIRMGKRLCWKIEASDELRSLALPPMLLQPLVENAVKHGLEPLEEGGSIAVLARAEGGRLMIRIDDDGAGPQGGHPDGAGVGIANVQSRLAALFGSDASLSLTENQPRGMTATLSLPLHRATTP